MLIDHEYRHCQRLILAGFILGLTMSLGCGGGNASRPKAHPVSGELFVKGQPAAGAKVILHPLENADPAAWSMGYPRATVEADGKFYIESFEPKDGAPAGKYKLLAYWLSGADGQEEDPSAQPRVNQIDVKYNDATQSPWDVTVEPKSNKLPRFEVP